MAAKKKSAQAPAKIGFIESMECLPVSTLPEGQNWSYEIKLDGFRLEAVKKKGETALFSRRGNILNRKFPYIATALEALPNDTILDGEVVEATPPRKLVQTWRMLMDPGQAAEGFTRLTYEIEAARGGVTRLTVTHDVTGTPMVAALVAGERESEGAGGGWNEILSGLKTLLETGVALPFQSGPR